MTYYSTLTSPAVHLEELLCSHATELFDVGVFYVCCGVLPSIAITMTTIADRRVIFVGAVIRVIYRSWAVRRIGHASLLLIYAYVTHTGKAPLYLEKEEIPPPELKLPYKATLTEY